MTIENPPRLWAFAVRGAIHAAPEEAPLLASVHQGWGASKPQAYVREDVAEAALDEKHAKLVEVADKLRATRTERDDAVREHRPFEEVRDFLLSQMVNLLADRCAEGDVDFVYDELHALDGDDLAMEMQEKQDKDESRREWQADQGLALSDYVGCFDEPEAETETTALRRERDALLVERDAVAREGWRACVLGVSIIRFWQAETKSRSGDQRGALALMNEAVALRDIFTAGDKAAGKGVG